MTGHGFAMYFSPSCGGCFGGLGGPAWDCDPNDQVVFRMVLATECWVQAHWLIPDVDQSHVPSC